MQPLLVRFVAALVALRRARRSGIITIVTRLACLCNGDVKGGLEKFQLLRSIQ